MLTKCLALEYGGSGILCVSVDPGCVSPPLGWGTVSDGTCTATLAQQSPTGIPSREIPSQGHPFPWTSLPWGTSLPIGIPSQGHPFPWASLPWGHPFPWTSLPRACFPRDIPSHWHPFPGTSSPPGGTHRFLRSPLSPRGAAPPRQRANSSLSPKPSSFLPIFDFISHPKRVSAEGTPAPCSAPAGGLHPGYCLPTTPSTPCTPRAVIAPNPSSPLTMLRGGKRGWRQAASCSVAGQGLPPRWLAA